MSISILIHSLTSCGRIEGVLRAMFGAEVPSLEDTLEGLANFVDQYLGAGALSELLRT